MFRINPGPPAGAEAGSSWYGQKNHQAVTSPLPYLPAISVGSIKRTICSFDQRARGGHRTRKKAYDASVGRNSNFRRANVAAPGLHQSAEVARSNHREVERVQI